MIKLIPIIIFPLSFFLIFLGVKNLTGNFPFNKENIDHNNKEEIVKLNQDSEKIVAESEKKLINNEQQSINVDENFRPTDEEEKKIIKEENINEILEKTELQVKSEKKKSNSKKSQKTTNINEDVKENTNNYLIQFGAFTKKKNAEDLKNSIIQKLHTKFPNFQINLDFDEKKKFYKLISQTNDFKKAKKVCSFSKEIKINCLFKKQ